MAFELQAESMTTDAPTTFAHPDWIRAISAQVPGSVHVQVPEQGKPRLELRLRKSNLHFDSWITPLTPNALPAASADIAPGDAALLFEQLASPVLLRNLPVEHPTTKALLAAATHVNVLNSWERSCLRLNGSYDAWLSTNFDHKRRKEYKRLRNRLSEQGELQVSRLQPGDDLAPYIKAFLDLEAMGWKGKRGTALQNDGQMVAALRNGLAALHLKGNIRFWLMQMDGRPIAALFALIDGPEATLGKIAHDETMSRYSPGVLIILAATEDLYADKSLTLADSNAIPGHPMIDRIWRDRLACMDVLLAGSNVSTALFSGIAGFLGMKNAMRNFAKRVILRVTGNRRS